MTHTPTPAEIETLRKGIRLNATPDERRAACDLVDRLSPPEPEQPDEATKIWRGMMDAGSRSRRDGSGYDYLGGGWDHATGVQEEIAYLRQVLSELIASKDAEIAEWKLASEEARSHWDSAVHEWNKAESELAALRAENERLKATLNTLGTRWALRKAAERNTAELKMPRNPNMTPCPECNGQLDSCQWPRIPSHPPKPDTAPVVEVTQADRDAVRKGLYWLSVYNQETAVEVCAFHRTEAEARGRREALAEAFHNYDHLRQTENDKNDD